MPPRAVVIGAGIGGTAATALLAHRGFDTTLVEKNPRIGGSCSGYEKRRFHIDIGTHMFCRGDRGPLGEVMRRVGRPGGIRFRRTRDIAQLRAVGATGPVQVTVPSQLHRVPQFAFELARALKLSPREAARVGRMFATILTMTDEEVEAWNHHTVEEFVACFSAHERVMSVFGFLLGLYFVLPYWDVSAGEALWSFRRMARDNALSYPEGGSIAIPTAYVDSAKRDGADVRVNAGVKQVVVRDGAVRGVVLSDGTELPADVVVSTSSVRSTVLFLVGEEHFPEAYVARAKAIRGSQIAVQAKVALDRKLVDAGCIVGGVGDATDLFRAGDADFRRMYEQVAQGRVPDVVPFYCPVPTNFDPSLAPPDCQLLTICAVAPTTDIQLEDPAAAWEEAMMKTLRRVVPGLDDHILFVDRFSVKFMERWLGKQYGPAISTGQTPDQVGAKRPTVHTPVRGLYMAGCGAGARGVGTELAAASAMECVERIAADLQRR